MSRTTVLPKGRENIALKVPKGTKDWAGADLVIRDKILSKTTEVFKRHGGVKIDTPVFELQEVLTGVGLKQLYNLADQGGEICSLRYDLTGSIARWLAMNPTIHSIKCYNIGKVYRLDGVREDYTGESYRCDFNIAGIYDPMLPDAEILRITTEILGELNVEEYTIRINHRKIINGIFESCGVPENKYIEASRAIGKLDQLPWDDVRIEMEQDVGLESKAVNMLWQYVLRKGGRHLQYDLLLEEDLTGNESFSSGLREVGLLFDYLEIFGAMPKVEFDLSLTRGYEYTGIIFEVITPAPIPPPLGESQITELTDEIMDTISLATGGRQDNLVESLSKDSLPCVGISFHVDQIYNVTKAKLSQETIRENEVDVYVMAFGDGLLRERMQVCRSLWDAGVKAEFSYKARPEFPYQISTAKKNGVPFAIILSEEKLLQEKAKIVDMGLREGHPQKTGVDVNFPDLVTEIKQRISKKREREDDEDDGEGGGEGDDKGDDESDGFKEHMDKVKLEGGTVEMEGIEIEMDFAKIRSKGVEIEVEGAKINMKKVKIELRGRKE